MERVKPKPIKLKDPEEQEELPKKIEEEQVEKLKIIKPEEQEEEIEEETENEFGDVFGKKSYADLEDKEAIKKLVFIDALLVALIATTVYFWLFA